MPVQPHRTMWIKRAYMSNMLHVLSTMAPQSSTLAWKTPWTEEPGRLQNMGSLGVGHDWVTSLSLSCIGEGNGNSLQCSCLENPRDGGAWWAPISGVAQGQTRLKRLSSSSSSKRGIKPQIPNLVDRSYLQLYFKGDPASFKILRELWHLNFEF